MSQTVLTELKLNEKEHDAIRECVEISRIFVDIYDCNLSVFECYSFFAVLNCLEFITTNCVFSFIDIFSIVVVLLFCTLWHSLQISIMNQC